MLYRKIFEYIHRIGNVCKLGLILSTVTNDIHLSDGAVMQVGKYPYKASSYYTAWINNQVEDTAERQRYIDF